MLKKISFIIIIFFIIISCRASIYYDDSIGKTQYETSKEELEKYGIDISSDDNLILSKIEENLKSYFQEKGSYRVIFTGIPKDYTQNGVESLSVLTIKAAMKIVGAKNIDVDISNIDFQGGVIREMMFSGESIADDIILNFIFPSNKIKTVESMAFMNLGNIKQITVPNSITMVGEYGFAYCYQLERLEFERGIQTIWPNSFIVAEKLKELIIPDTVKSIESESLGNSGITELTIPLL